MLYRTANVGWRTEERCNIKLKKSPNRSQIHEHMLQYVTDATAEDVNGKPTPLTAYIENVVRR